MLALTVCELEFVPKAGARQLVVHCPLELCARKQQKQGERAFPQTERKFNYAIKHREEVTGVSVVSRKAGSQPLGRTLSILQ